MRVDGLASSRKSRRRVAALSSLAGIALLGSWALQGRGCSEETPPGHAYLRAQLLEQLGSSGVTNARSALDGLNAREVGVDSTGHRPASYLVSLVPTTEKSRMSARRSLLVRGSAPLELAAVAVGDAEQLLFSLGRVEELVKRSPLRPGFDRRVTVSSSQKSQVTSIRIDPLRIRRWSQHALSLRAFRGQMVRLRFELAGWFQRAGDHVFVAEPMLTASRPESQPRPNIALVWLDKLRADLLEVNGAPADLLPNLNALVRQGAVFTQARSHSDITERSTLQTLTSRFVTQAFEVGGAESSAALPRELSRAGWYAVALGINHHVSSIPSFGRKQLDVGFSHIETDLRVARDWGDDELYRTQVVPWLRSELREPFFLNLHFQGAHEPYRSAMRDGNTPLFRELMKRTRGEQVEARYLYKAHLADAVVGKLLADLQARGLRKNTLLVVMSDHGSLLYDEHRAFQWEYPRMIRVSHPTGLYEPQVRVPLVFAGPGITAGARYDEPVGLMDLAPTVLERVGLPVPPSFEGRAWSARLSGGPPLATAPHFLLEEDQGLLGVVADGYKLTQFLEPVEGWPVGPLRAPTYHYSVSTWIAPCSSASSERISAEGFQLGCGLGSKPSSII